MGKRGHGGDNKLNGQRVLVFPALKKQTMPYTWIFFVNFPPVFVFKFCLFVCLCHCHRWMIADAKTAQTNTSRLMMLMRKIFPLFRFSSSLSFIRAGVSGAKLQTDKNTKYKQQAITNTLLCLMLNGWRTDSWMLANFQDHFSFCKYLA